MLHNNRQDNNPTSVHKLKRGQQRAGNAAKKAHQRRGKITAGLHKSKMNR